MSSQPQPTPPRDKRVVAFVSLCVAATALASGYALWARHRTPPPAGTAAIPDPSVVDDAAALAAVAARSHVVFINTKPGAGRGRIVLVPLDHVDGPRFLTPLRCERLDATATSAVCLNGERGVLTKFFAYPFDEHFVAGARIPLQGIPSRVRVSPDGRLAGFTVFISGDSYSPGHFSTRTTLIEAASGKELGELEEFAVVKDGRQFKQQDFNFWGVTFAADGDRLYATLASGGQTWLVEGRVSTKTATVIRPDVECPSLSPDGRRVAFKSRQMIDGRLIWQLHVYDLDRKTETVVETRSVDDQAAWLDADRVLYALPRETGTTGGTDVWVVRADGTQPPALWIENAYSPAVVRPANAARCSRASS